MAAPRNLVSLDAVSKSYGSRNVFDVLSLGVAAGERIGVVGRNGDGKSTLLRLIGGTEHADSGQVTRTGGLVVGMLAQGDDLDPKKTIRDEVVGGLADHEWLSDARIRDVFAGLLGGIELAGFSDGLDTLIAPLSGGERRRVALVKLLLDNPELLLLDEPTNHLDIEGVDWLATHLAARKGTVVVVTHDRWFLDSVCTTTWEVSDGEIHQHEGSYAAYVLGRAERERLAAGAEERRRNLVRKELAWLRRGPPARTSKPRFRIDAANALIADVPEPRDRAELLRFATARLGKSVLDVEHASVTLGDRKVLSDVTWRIGPGDRLALVGVNGSGKTTLIRLLTGALEPSTGEVKRGLTVRIAYLSQAVEEIDGEQRVLESLQSIRERTTIADSSELTAGQLCERFGFGGNRQWTLVRDLSGGERRRLQLMRLLMDEPNVLLLDEPTNDLDIDTLTALEDLLDDWPGTLVVVSHDRYFVERVCDDVYALTDDGGLGHLTRGVEQYVELRRAARETAVLPAPTRAVESSSPKGTAIRQAKKESQRIERELDRLSRREAEIHTLMSEHATDYARTAELDSELRAVAVGRDALEEAWLENAELLEG